MDNQINGLNTNDITLKELGFKEKFECLKITTVKQLCLLSEETLRLSLKMTEKQITQIKLALEKYGFSLLKPTYTNITNESSIEELALPNIILNILIRNGIFTIGDLCSHTKEYYEFQKFMGPKRLSELFEVIKNNNLKLANVNSIKITPDTTITLDILPFKKFSILKNFGIVTFGDLCLLKKKTLIYFTSLNYLQAPYLEKILSNNNMSLFTFLYKKEITKDSSIEVLNIPDYITYALIRNGILRIRDLLPVYKKLDYFINISYTDMQKLKSELRRLNML